jgi:hypothetical protein
MRTIILRDTPLASFAELLTQVNGVPYQFEEMPESYLSGETNASLLTFLMRALPMAMTYTKVNGVWHIRPRGERRTVAPQFVSLEDVRQGQVQLPVIAGAPRRTAAIVLGDKPVALLEAGNPPKSQDLMVREGERRFLVPLVPLNPIL